MMLCLRSIALCAVGVFFVSCAATHVQAGDPESDAARRGVAFFEQHVRPLLVEKCQSCHGVKRQESKLRLDARTFLLRGGASGPAVKPGSPNESLLMEAVRREGLEMPPEEKLSDSEIKTLETWIRLGAPWPKDASGPAAPALGDQVHIHRVAKSHWAFQPIEKPAVPAVTLPEPAKAVSPIDAFVLARLQAEGLEPAPPADRRTLIRRATFDLIGLPPTAREIEAFANDKSPEAFAKVVDRLLDSPHYGERWGRYWLDIARYADTRDWKAQTDPRYPFAYTYRDYVIKAFNSDVPYDRFIREQLAADAYAQSADDPSLAALGFLTVGPRYRDNVQEQIADRIDVVTRGLLGVSVGCARCHDHKYDPIPTTDYYALYGVFASSEEPEELPLIAGASPPEKLIRDYERQRAEKVDDLKNYQQKLQRDATADMRKRLGEYLQGYYEMNIVRKKSIRGLLTSRKLKETAMTPLAQNLDRIRTNRGLKSHPVLTAWAALIGADDAKFTDQLQAFLSQTTTKQTPPVNPRVLEALKEQQPKNPRDLLTLYAGLFEQALKSSGGNSAAADADLSEIRQLLDSPAGPFHLDIDAVTQASRLLGPGARNSAI